MAFIDLLFPYIAWFVCIALLAIPGLWGAVFTFSLLGHLSQFLFKKDRTRVARE